MREEEPPLDYWQSQYGLQNWEEVQAFKRGRERARIVRLYCLYGAIGLMLLPGLIRLAFILW